MVEQAFGLAGNIQFVNVLVYVSARRDTQSQQISQDGYGGEEKALVKKRDFNSYQKSPKWIDPPIVSSLQPQGVVSTFTHSYVYSNCSKIYNCRARTARRLSIPLWERKNVLGVTTIDFFFLFPFQEFHPHISGMTTLVIRLCSIDASYAPRPDRAAPGSVTANKGKNLSIVPFCWTVLPLFSR